MDRPTPKLNWAQRWMRTVIELEGEQIPGGATYISSALDFSELAKQAALAWVLDDDVRCLKCTPPSAQMLRRVLKRDYPKVLFPSRYDYAACEACIKLRVARRRGIEMDSEVTSHQIMYRAERKDFNDRKVDARDSPHLLHLITVDFTRCI